eukprot:6142440-Lingulodinium_polyedra.AAC.1
MSCESGQLILSPGRLRVAPGPAPEAVVPPAVWPVAEASDSPSGPVAGGACVLAAAAGKLAVGTGIVHPEAVLPP